MSKPSNNNIAIAVGAVAVTAIVWKRLKNRKAKK